MKKTGLTLLLITSLIWVSKAQSKVLKEVSKDMETKVEPIMQDNTLIGYVVFNKLEKVSTDSFSYKLEILDENLNDIGSYSFKNLNIQLQDVAFDDGVICLGYLRNNAPEKYKPGSILKKVIVKDVVSTIYFQLLDLNGKLVNEYSEPVAIQFHYLDYFGEGSSKFKGILRSSLKIRNIPGKGFFVSYAEPTEFQNLIITYPPSLLHYDNRQKIMMLDMAGKKLWDVVLPDSKLVYELSQVSPKTIYVLRKNYEGNYMQIDEGGYEILSINAENGNITKQENLIDGEGNSLKVLNFSNEVDPENPSISGLILNREIKKTTVKGATRGHYSGVFNLTPKDSLFIIKYSYWSNDEYSPQISNTGFIEEIQSFPGISYSFGDAQGNTYYAGTGIEKKGTKRKLQGTVILKQDSAAHLSYYCTMDADENKSSSEDELSNFSKPSFTVSKSKFLVQRDIENTYIYNIQEKKMLKKIPHQSGNISTAVYRAKEDHIMIAEHNSKEGTTKLSIESL